MTTIKSIVVAGLVVVLTLSVCGCKKAETTDTTTEANATPTSWLGNDPLVAEPGTKVLAVNVSGMTCEGCVNSVGGSLAKLGGVKQTRVSLEKETAWVMVNLEGGPTIDQLIATIASMGEYEATPAIDIPKPGDVELPKPPIGDKEG